MDDIRKYLLSIIAAGIICALASQITNSKGSHSAVIKLLTGLFLAITVISPLATVKFSDITAYINEFESEANDAVAAGTDWAEAEMSAIIKKQTEAYILDKAQSMGATLSVKVTVSDTYPPEPLHVTLQGSVDPYKRQILQQIIEDDLSIAKEHQTWE